MSTITDFLIANRDPKNAVFVAKLIPNINAERILGLKTPTLRKYAKQIADTKDADELLITYPHQYIEEDTLHAFLIAQIRDFNKCIEQTELFLPYIDNWAVCDQFSPTCFAKYKQQLLPYIEVWLQGRLFCQNTVVQQYTNKNTPKVVDNGAFIIRYGIGMLLRHFLDDDFEEQQMRTVAAINADHYYVMMMKAWYFATALAKQYDTALRYLPILDKTTLTKTIQKARESFRVSADHKAELQNLLKHL